MSEKPRVTDVIRDATSDPELLIKAIERWLRVDRDADPVEELELQSIASSRVMIIKSDVIHAIETADAVLRLERRRAAIAAKYRDEEYEDQCNAALLRSIQRIEAKYAEDEKRPPKARIDQEAKADPEYLEEKRRLRDDVLGHVRDEQIDKVEADIRDLNRKRQQLDALITRLQGRYWTLQELVKDRQREFDLSGKGRYS